MKKTELMLALDVKNLPQAEKILKKLKGIVRHYKIGPVLFTACGPESIKLARKYGGRVFLDLKFHDIPNTVKNAVEQARKAGVYAVSVHISGGIEMLNACMSLEKRPKLWGITALTSFDEKSFSKLGFKNSIGKVINNFAKVAAGAGIDGIVCSGLEAGRIKKRFGKKLEVIVPGIRLSGAKHDRNSASGATGVGGYADDQKRTITPQDAARLGADFIVVGRPVLEAANPVSAAKSILEELQ
ncbi:MAG: orotidine-5'-phosphate decarboxylase [Elusimicrobia bacterium]|nr:orotidine-5'-phosphate decarboxylase [Elusimicrobiota bacterium]